jgi:ribosomal protein S18 acetylase RimI-like enzyme
MTTAVLEPVRMRKDQNRPVGDVLGRAFETNPGFVWALPDASSRLRKLTWFMETATKIGDKYGEVYTTPEGVDGGAIWLPPGKTTLSLPQMLTGGFLSAPLRWGIGPFMRFMGVVSRFEHLHKEAMPGDHWYLFILGVDPPRQQQGIGSALIQPGLRKADESRLPCYLETDKTEDVAFYRKHGFDVLVTENFPKGGPTFWTMRRPPADPS